MHAIIRAAAVGLALAIGLTANAARERTIPRATIAEVLAGRSGNGEPYQVTVSLTGAQRAVDDAKRVALTRAFAKDPRGADLALLLDMELEVTDGKTRYWVPVNVTGEALRRGKEGDRVILVVERLNAAEGGPLLVASRAEWWGNSTPLTADPADATRTSDVMRLRYARGIVEQLRWCAEHRRMMQPDRGFPASLRAPTRAARCIAPEILDRPVFGYHVSYIAGPPGESAGARLYFACARPLDHGPSSAVISADEEGLVPPLGIGTTGRQADCIAPWIVMGGPLVLRAIKHCLVIYGTRSGDAFPPDLSALGRGDSPCQGRLFKLDTPTQISVDAEKVFYEAKRNNDRRISGFRLRTEEQLASGRHLYLDEQGGVRLAWARPAGSEDLKIEEDIAQQSRDAERATQELPTDRQRCQSGAASACTEAGFKAWIAWRSVDAIPLWEQACALGDKEGCLLAKSRPYGIALFNTILAHRRACFRGETKACGGLVDLVAESKAPKS
ncbi:MAG: hypothetical protein ACKVQU_34345 [Burkholderiales bacterium]